MKVTIEDDLLSIAGEKKVEHIDDKTHFSKRSYGSFTRSFTLPGDADRDAITAKFAKGVLTLEIAKTIEVHVRASYRSKGGLRDGSAGVAPGRVDARELATWETTMSPRIVTFTVNPALDVAMEARRSPPRPQNTGPAGRRPIQVVASWDEYE